MWKKASVDGPGINKITIAVTEAIRHLTETSLIEKVVYVVIPISEWDELCHANEDRVLNESTMLRAKYYPFYDTSFLGGAKPQRANITEIRTVFFDTRYYTFLLIGDKLIDPCLVLMLDKDFSIVPQATATE